jgi:hypothetical protein
VLTYGIIYLFFLEGKTVGEAPTVVLYYYLKKTAIHWDPRSQRKKRNKKTEQSGLGHGPNHILVNDYLFSNIDFRQSCI